MSERERVVIVLGVAWLNGLDIGLWLVELALVIVLGVALFGVFKAIDPGKGTIGAYTLNRQLMYRRKHGLARFMRKLLLIDRAKPASVQTLERLLQECGLRVDIGTYMTIKRLLLLAAIVIGYSVCQAWTGVLSSTVRFAILTATFVIVAGCLADRPLLEKLRRTRRYRILRDIDAISRQLLYDSGVTANLHSKLNRCLPFARAIRREWYMLLAEWYHNAETALARFKERVATDEATSLAETLNVLRQYDHDQYYTLLKERIVDCKEKLALFKESRKETMSYVLFILSGIPILFTFRLFIYPWVMAGQKLFESLN